MSEEVTKRPLLNRGFISLSITQFFGASNDYLLKTLLTFALAASGIWRSKMGEGGQVYPAYSLVIPFLLFCVLAGQIADRHSKQQVTVRVKQAEIFFALMAFAGFWMANFWLCLAAMVFLGIQSAFFSPAKYGLIPELVDEKDLSRANGIINMLTNLAAIFATVVGSYLYELYEQDENFRAAKPGTVLWEFDGSTVSVPIDGDGGEGGGYDETSMRTTYGWSSTPAIGTDGTIFVGADYGDSGKDEYGGKIFALDGKTGAKKWEFETIQSEESECVSSPAIGVDGTVFIGASFTNREVKREFGGRVYALDGKTGAKKWEFETRGWVEASPAIGSDGTVYIGESYPGSKVYALDGKTGAKKWEFKTGGNVESTPAIGSDGTIYIGSGDRKVYALEGKTGAKKWEFETGSWTGRFNTYYGGVSSSPAIGADGTIYVGSNDKKVYALDGKTGAKKWEFKSGHAVQTSPAIGLDGTIFIGSDDYKLYALDGKTGAKRWEFTYKTGDEGHKSSPAIGSDGTVYFRRGGGFFALDGTTGNIKWEVHSTGKDSSPVIGPNGTLYIGLDRLSAIKTGSKGPAKSPWPLFGQNARHTGRATPTKKGTQAVSEAQGPLGKLWLPGLVMLGVAILGLIASLWMPKLKARNPDAEMQWDIFGSVFSTLREMKNSGNPILIVAALWSMFYLIAYTIMLILPDYTKVLDISVSQVGLYLLGPMGICIGLGSALAGWISGSRIQPRFVPAGAIGLTICFLLLGWAPAKLWVVVTYIALMGICAGFYIVPLQALMQKLSPDQSRGRFLGAAAAMASVFEIVGIGVFHVSRRVFDIPSQRIFLIVGVLGLAATILFYWKVRRHIHKPEWQ